MNRLWTSLALAVLLGSASAARPQNATILYTGDTRAFLESCGCQDEALGGISRRGTLVERYRARDLPVLLVDAGGFGDGEEERDQERVETYLQAMAALDYDAVNLTGEEFRFGPELVRRTAGQLPFLSSNLRHGHDLGVPAYLVRQLGPWKVGLLGLGSSRSDSAAALFAPPAQALAGVVAGLRSTTDYLVLLSGLDEEENQALATRFPQVDLIIGRGPGQRRSEGRTAILGSAPQGTHLGRVELRAESGSRPAVASADFVPISADLPELTPVRKLVDAFYAAVTRQSPPVQAPLPPSAGQAPSPDSANTYLGAQACAPCHPDEESAWRATPHARAFATLLQKNRHFFPDCAVCHTTGFGQPSGFAIGQDRDALAGVQCEVCHGPGRRHASRPEPANIRRGVDPALCQQCHTPAQSPDFAVRPGEYLAQVDHRSRPARPPAVAAAAPLARAQGGKTRLELFVMSLCPYGMEAERALIPLAERFADLVELEIYFIADERGVQPARSHSSDPQTGRPGCAASGAGSGNGPFSSLHGQAEVEEGRRQLIVRADHPERYFRYLLCRSRQGPQGDWQECAQAVGLDPDSLQQAALSRQGEELFRQNIHRANALGLDLSPTLLIDGEEFGGRLEGFPLARYLCRQYPGNPRCREVPACGADADCQGPPGKVGLCLEPDTPKARCEYRDPVPFSLAVLNTDQCPACATGDFLRTTIPLFPQVQVSTYSLETPAGAELARRYGIQVLPAYIFSKDFDRSPRFPRVEHLVLEKGDHYLLMNRLAGISYWRDRPALPGRLDVFLSATDLLTEDQVLALWPTGSTAVRIHHLLDPGQRERPPTEVVRRACLAESQPDRYRAYAAARNQQLRTRRHPEEEDEWQAVARHAGVDMQELDRCTTSGTGQRLLAAAAAQADSLELAPATTSALIGNQLLVRRAQPRQFMALWQEGTPP